MRAAQTSTVDIHAALFENCDIFIDTDDDAWMFIAANHKARAVIDALIDAPRLEFRNTAAKVVAGRAAVELGIDARAMSAYGRFC